MGRKFSKKMNRKMIWQGLGLFVFFSTATTLFFQNCSQVSVSDMTVAGKEEAARILRIGAGEVVVDVGASQYDKTETQFNIDLKNVSPLKQLWVVDNSMSMVFNGLNLANSFSAMFDSNNTESLYKFDTTAYLFSTAQLTPKYTSSADPADLVSIYDFQKNFVRTPIDATTYARFRDDSFNPGLNLGVVPGDNVGIEVTKPSSTSKDFQIKIAPVLSKVTSGNTTTFSAAIYKQGNVSTANFEADFRNKLAILDSRRIPAVTVSGVNYQQNYNVVDSESGLCAVARILENPNGMYNSSDLLSFSIVTDENEADISGANCIKRTAWQTDSTLLTNGKCYEYDTTIKFKKTPTSASSCSLTGNTGYTATFTYPLNTGDVTYLRETAKAYKEYKTPQTLVRSKKEKFKSQRRFTNVAYTPKTLVPAKYDYKQRRTKIYYYNKTCNPSVQDGVRFENCSPVATRQELVVKGAINPTTCYNAVRAASAAAILAVEPGITNAYLPDCSQPAVIDSNWSAAAECSPVDNIDCFKNSVPYQAAYWSYGTRVTNGKSTGDMRSKCDMAALALNSSAAVSTDTTPSTHAADKLPSCTMASGGAEWEDFTCDYTTDVVNCRKVSNGFDYVDNTVLGSFPDQSPECLSKAPTGWVVDKCSVALDRITTNVCSTQDAALGCVFSKDVPRVTENLTLKNQPQITNRAECEALANKQTDKAFTDPSTVGCFFNTGTGNITVTRTFAQTQSVDLGNTIAKDLGCGILTDTFFNALIASDQARATKSSCKITAINAAIQALFRPLATGGTCAAQKDTDCAALNMRSCSTSTVAPTAGAEETHPGLLSIQKSSISCTTSLCKDLPKMFCETTDNDNLTLEQFLQKKYGQNGAYTVQCILGNQSSAKVVSTIAPIFAKKWDDRASFCPVDSGTKTPRYYIADNPSSPTYTYSGPIIEYVAGNDATGNSPNSNLIEYIKRKITDQGLNVNFSLFIRRTGDPEVVGMAGPKYIGKQYEEFADALGSINGINVQRYYVGAESYAPALANLGAELNAKLTRSFNITGLKPYHVITDVSIVKNSGTLKLAIGDWTQPVGSEQITIDRRIPINEGDKVVVKYQNDDGYIRDQLKKIFVVDEMRPDQIVLSVEHIKSTGETVLLSKDQWMKEGNKISIAPSVILNGGDQFRIKFKNDTTEE